MKTLCEWNPARDEIVLTIGEDRIGCHEPAALSLGRYGEWHLCARCASLSAFAHFRDRSTLAALAYAAEHARPQASKGVSHPRRTGAPHYASFACSVADEAVIDGGGAKRV